MRGVLGGVVSLPLLSHAELSITALRTLAAYAPWLAPASRAEPRRVRPLPTTPRYALAPPPPLAPPTPSHTHTP